MAQFLRECRNGHRCENGSLCQEDPAQEGSFFCDCNGDFAGLYCEYNAETYCSLPQETSNSWFCVNRGTCVASTKGGKATFDCDCPSEYDGPHCEFVRGAAPENWPGASELSQQRNRRNRDGLSIGVGIVIALAALVFVCLVGFLVMKSLRRRKHGEGVDQHAAKDQSEALNIAMDGSGLRQSINQQQQGGKRTTEQYGYEADDGMSMEVPGDPQIRSTPEFSNGHGGML